jgi:alkylhydroperoxidase family enzyme
MLEALMLNPERFGAEQFEPMRAAGHDRIAMEDAVAVGAMFAAITRIADCLGFEHPNTATQKMTTRYLLGVGYGPATAELVGPHRFARVWADLRHAVLTTPGHGDAKLREQVYEWIERDARRADAKLDELPRELQALVGKASRKAHAIDDEDMNALLRQGWDEAGAFEIVVAISSAAGASRYAIAMEAIDGLERASALG